MVGAKCPKDPELKGDPFGPRKSLPNMGKPKGQIRSCSVESELTGSDLLVFHVEFPCSVMGPKGDHLLVLGPLGK